MRLKRLGFFLPFFFGSVTACKVSSKLGILVEGRLRCIGSPAHLHKRFSRHVTVSVQCSQVVPLETALRTLDPQMKLAEVVRLNRVYLLTNSVEQAALLQNLEKLHTDGIVQVNCHFLPNCPYLFDLFAAI